MNAEEYMHERVEDQIAWYSRKSLRNQRWFKGLSLAQVASAAAIPVLASQTADQPLVRLIVGGLGAVVAILAASVGLFKFQERWIEYRTTSESLKKEKFLFQTRVEPYAGEDAFNFLVQRVETLVSKENTNWAQYMMKPHVGGEGGH